MAAEGRLARGGAADLLSQLWDQTRTGILDLKIGGTERKFIFVGGEIRYVTSSDTAEKLPLRLVAAGLVSKQLLLELGRGGTDLRQGLLDRGVPPDVHDRELAALVASLVSKVFPETQGEFSFVDKADLQLPGLLPALDMLPVLWAAAGQASPEFARGFLGDFAQRVVRTGDDDVVAQLPGLTPQQAYLISRVDGYSSVNDLLVGSPLPEDATLRLVLGLCCVGVLEVTGRPALRLPKAARGTTRRKATTVSKPAASGSAISHAGTILPAAGAAPAVAPEGAPSTWHVGAIAEGGLTGAHELHAKTTNADHYVVLGASREGNDADIRRAYYSLAKMYHPDRFGRETLAADREVVEDLFARMGTAFDVLSDPEKRREYDEKLRSGALAAEQEQREKKVDRKDIAKESHEKGKHLLGLGERSRGLQFLEHAVETEPDVHEYRMTLSRMLIGDSRTRKRAERHLLEAIRIDPSKPDAYHLLGVIYKHANLRTRALEQFQKGLGWDPRHEGILTEMASLDEGTGGKLGGLFGKKK